MENSPFITINYKLISEMSNYKSQPFESLLMAKQNKNDLEILCCLNDTDVKDISNLLLYHVHIMNYISPYGAHIGMYDAAKDGYMDVTNFIIHNIGNIYWFQGFLGASEGGNLTIINYMLEQKLESKNNINPWNMGLYHACLGGHIEVVKFMIDHGASNINAGIIVAQKHNHTEVIKFLQSI